MKISNARIHAITLLITFLVSSLIFLGFALIPYNNLKNLADHIAQDGNFQSFTPSISQSIRLPSAAIGLIFLIAGIISFLFFPKFLKSVSLGVLRINSFRNALCRDIKEFFSDLLQLRLNIQKKEWAGLALIAITGFIARLMVINRAIEYDEAYTFMVFARNSFYYAISNYHVPNNHVFHTILVRIFYLLLGDSPWQIRLPAFTAGLFLIFSTYLLGRMIYGKVTGFIAAGIVASLPIMITRSASARGYTILTLMTMLAFLSGGYVIKKKNLFGWFLLSLFCAIGFFTIPIMLYPFSFLILWLALSIFTLEKNQYKWIEWIKYLCLSVGTTVLLTGLLYAPIIFSQNIGNIFHNPVLKSLSALDFLQSLPKKLQEIFHEEWLLGLTTTWVVILAIGLVLSLLQIKSNSKYKVPLQFVFIISMCILLIIQRPDSISRIWFWAVPFLAIWSSSGLTIFSNWFRKKSLGRAISITLPIMIGIGLAINGFLFTHKAVVNSWSQDPIAEEVTLFLQPRISSNSVVIVSQCSDARYWYYFFLHGIPISAFYDARELQNFDKAFVIVYSDVNPSCGSEVTMDVLKTYGPDLAELNLSTLTPIAKIEYATIYEISTTP